MYKVQRVIIVVGTGRSSENICSSSGGAQERRKDKMKLSSPTKIGGKTSLGPSYFLL
jgi:hypothetical protein